MTAVMPATGLDMAQADSRSEPRLLGPADRLAESREHMRRLMLEKTARHRAAPASGHAEPSFAAPLFEKLRSLAGVDVILDTIHHWWAHHPYRAAALVAGDAARTAAIPVAERHPLALVGVAALIGAVLVRLRPWRWLLRRALIAGLLPRLVSRAVASVPVEAWVSGLSAFARTRHEPAAPAYREPVYRESVAASDR